jgi:UTP--glucose-1-phosphate uridylyltransferase
MRPAPPVDERTLVVALAAMLIRKAVFPAAGLGTRFLPATKAQPKEMLPLVDKPIIQYVIEEAVASGITSIIIVTGKGKNAIEDHFDVSKELERLLEERGQTVLLDQVRSISNLINVSYVRQGESLGLGHAVLMAKDLVADEPFAVMLGDDIIDSPVPCMKQMIDVFGRHGGPVIAVQQVPKSEISAYGVIDGVPEAGEDRVYRIRDLMEKPKVEEAPSDLAIIGRYILTPDIFEELEKTPRDQGGEIQLTNGMRQLSRKRSLFGYRFEGRRHDAGNKLGFLKATVEFALKREDLGGPFREYLKSLNL